MGGGRGVARTAVAPKSTQTQVLRACQALLEALSKPLWVWKGTPGPLLGHLLGHTGMNRGNP